MRLFRRSLLCLVVGVTAFGVAGWGFRPRAKWEVRLPRCDGGYWLAFTPQTSSVILVTERGPLTSAGARLFDLQTGTALTTIPAPPEFRYSDPIVRDDGLILATFGKVGQNQEALATRFDLLRPDGSQISSREFPGAWSLCSDNKRAWTFISVEKGFRFQVVQIEDGTVLSSLDFLREYKTFSDEAISVSDDAEMLAVCEEIRLGASPPFGIEVWDVATGRVVRRIAPPSEGLQEGERAAKQPLFTDRGRVIEYGMGEPGARGWGTRLYYDLARSAHVEPWRPARPPDAPSEFFANPYRYSEEEDLWFAGNAEGNYAAFAPFRDEEQVSPWITIPFAFESVGYCAAAMTTRGRQVVFHSVEPHWSVAVPEQIRDLFPKSLTPQPSVDRFRWYAEANQVWRDVGCDRKVAFGRIREGAFITLAVGDADDEWLLQSWPLPPRDPKWPALGIAAACMAGTWWGVRGGIGTAGWQR